MFLQISARTCQFVMERDGTEVDDEEFFQQMAPHSVLVILDTGQTWSGSTYVLSLPPKERNINWERRGGYIRSLLEDLE